MLTARRMKHVRLLVLTESLPQAALALAQTASFHPDERLPDAEALATLPGHDYRATYNQAHHRLDKILHLLGQADTPLTLEAIEVVDEPTLSAQNDWLGARWREASAFEDELRRLDERERAIREQRMALRNFAELDVDLGALRTRTRFLDLRLGLVPREHLDQLRDAASLSGYVLFVFRNSAEQVHVILAGARDGSEPDAMDDLLASAGFQTLAIPEELDAPPEMLRANLITRQARLGEERQAVLEQLAAWAAPHAARLAAARRLLLLAEPLVTLDPALRGSRHLAHLAGWVPARAVSGLRQRLTQQLGAPFSLTVREPRADERALVPTLVSGSRLLAPFATLVRQYGIPAYGEVDPTPLFALTFLLMFGSMFGDVGQGAVIAIAGWIWRRRLGRFWPFAPLAGLSSMLFGALYGSVFGYEDLIAPLWMQPLHDPLLMLSIALGWGVVFITVACLLAIYNRLVTGNYRGALLAHHGVINLAFYLALVVGAVRLARGHDAGLAAPALAVAALGVLAWQGWREQRGTGLGEKILVTFIDTLETIISYLSNTLSFLRVAAFSLNHVALSIAVFTLAGMFGAFGHTLTVILGNVFVLVLEGGIVMIQVMRLQYYEGFSRYFAGDGHAFRPLRLRRTLS